MAKSKKYINARSKLKVRSEMLADPSDPRHGTTNGYGVGCRCDRCRAAMRAYSARRLSQHRDVIRQKQSIYYRKHKNELKDKRIVRYAKAKARLEADPLDPQHGTRTGYIYGCRCDKCRQANHDYSVERWLKKKGTS